MVGRLPSPSFEFDVTFWASELKKKKIMEFFGYKDDCLKKKTTQKIDRYIDTGQVNGQVNPRKS